MADRSATHRPRRCAFGTACTTDPDARLRHDQPIYQATGGVAHRACFTTATSQLAAIRANVDTRLTGSRQSNTLAQLAFLDSFAVALTNLRFTPTGVLLVDIPDPPPPAGAPE